MQTRTSYARQLEHLNTTFIRMGALISGNIERAIIAYENADAETAEQVLENDAGIQQLHQSIQQQCTHLMACHQPLGHDLSHIIALLQMSFELELVHQLGNMIAQAAQKTPNPIPLHLKGIRHMDELARSMIADAITAYVEKDASLATDVQARIPALTKSFTGIKRALVSYIGENPEKTDNALETLLVSKYLNRLGYHSARIAGYTLRYLTQENTVRVKHTQP